MFEPYWNVSYPYDHSHRQQFDYLNLGYLAKHVAFIHDSQLAIYQGNTQHDVELIRSCAQKTGRLPVLCLDSNPYDVDQYVHLLSQFVDPKRYFVFHSDIRPCESRFDNVAPWPSWLLYQHFLPDDQQGRPKTYRISFLSGLPRPHRLWLFDKIKSKITDQDVVVINSFQKNNLCLTQDQLNSIPWSNHDQWFDTDQNSYNAVDPAHNKHPAYAACVNITGETLGTGDQVLPSEKTWKAYKSGCLVVNYGVKHMTEWLSSVGIELWKDFDITAEYQHKADKIKELFELSTVRDLYQDNLNLIEHNKNLIMSKQFVVMLAKSAIEKLESVLL